MIIQQAVTILVFMHCRCRRPLVMFEAPAGTTRGDQSPSSADSQRGADGDLPLPDLEAGNGVASGTAEAAGVAAQGDGTHPEGGTGPTFRPPPLSTTPRRTMCMGETSRLQTLLEALRLITASARNGARRRQRCWSRTLSRISWSATGSTWSRQWPACGTTAGCWRPGSRSGRGLCRGSLRARGQGLCEPKEIKSMI